MAAAGAYHHAVHRNDGPVACGRGDNKWCNKKEGTT